MSCIAMWCCADHIVIEDNPFHLIGAFPGPVSSHERCLNRGAHNSPIRHTREGTTKLSVLIDIMGKGKLIGQDIRIPDAYPFQPVKMKFIT